MNLAPDLLRLILGMCTRARTIAGWTTRALVVCLFALVDSSCGRQRTPAVEERAPAESPPANVPPPQVGDMVSIWAAAINGMLEGTNTEILARITNNIGQAFDQSPYLAIP